MSLYQGENKIASNTIVGDTLPIGSMVPYPSDVIPDNWLLCNGQAVSRTTYSLLFAVIGTSHGAGDGSTTFNIPNIKSRTIVGKDSADTDFDTLGETLGSKTETLTISQIPSHDHDVNVDYIDGSPTHGHGTRSGYLMQGSAQRTGTFVDTSAIANIGGGGSHNNIQPSIVENYIIKAKQSVGLIATVKDNLTSTSPTDALSANQGKVLNEKYTKHMVSAITLGRPIVNIPSSYAFAVIPLDTAITIGTKLTFDNANDRIVIGTGVTKIKVSAKGNIYSTPSATLLEQDFGIRLNSAVILQTYQNRVSGQSFNDHTISEKILNVVAGDYIQIAFNSTATGNHTILSDGVGTYLTVEVVE